MAYRTQKQLHEVIELAEDGNITQAAQAAVNYGIYAADIDTMLDISDWETLTTLLYVTEGAAKIRSSDNA